MNDESEYCTFTTTLYDPKRKKWITRTVEYRKEMTVAISGGAKPSIQLEIIDGALVIGKAAMRQGAVNNVDVAVQDLLKGKVVFLQQYGDLQTQVTRTINMTLKGGDK